MDTLKKRLILLEQKQREFDSHDYAYWDDEHGSHYEMIAWDFWELAKDAIEELDVSEIFEYVKFEMELLKEDIDETPNEEKDEIYWLMKCHRYNNLLKRVVQMLLKKRGKHEGNSSDNII